MYKNILVPIALDHDRDVSAALDIARKLAAPGASITALTVIEAMPAYILAQMPEAQVLRNQAAALDAIKAQIGERGEVRAVAVEGHPARSILDHAEEQGIDCIVIASHRPGLQDFFLGSTAARVVRHAACSVHVLR